MRVLLNTSFFFAPEIESDVREMLRAEWVGELHEPMILSLPGQDGMIGLAVQSVFDSNEKAAEFLKLAEPKAAGLLKGFGVDKFIWFSTPMAVVGL